MKLYDETDCLPHVKPAPLSGWQPIETAPKDGTLILLNGSGIVAPGIYLLGDWRFWEGDTTDDCAGNPAGAFNGWIRGYGPTHWMPLPAPPVADAVLREAGE